MPHSLAGCHKVPEHASGARRKLARLVGRREREKKKKKRKRKEGMKGGKRNRKRG